MVAVTIISDMSELIYGTDPNLIYWHVAILGKKNKTRCQSCTLRRQYVARQQDEFIAAITSKL